MITFNYDKFTFVDITRLYVRKQTVLTVLTGEEKFILYISRICFALSFLSSYIARNLTITHA